MQEVTLPYTCPKTGAKFLTPHGCSVRLGKLKHVSGRGSMDPYAADYGEFCRECSGPVLNGSQVIVEPISPIPLAQKRYAEAAKIRAERHASGKYDASRHKKFRKPMSIKDTFRALAPGDLWTGTICGCTKPKFEFPAHEPYRCKPCHNKFRKPAAQRYRDKSRVTPVYPTTCPHCGKPAFSRGMCRSEYSKWYRKNREKLREARSKSTNNERETAPRP